MDQKKVIIKNPVFIEPALLQKCHLLEIESKNRTFSKKETETAVSYVDSGGRLLVVIDEELRSPLLPNGVNSILSRFGLQFTADTEYAHNCGAVAKAGVINKENREIPYSGGRAVDGGNPFAWRLGQTGDLAEPFAAYVALDSGGKVVALAEAMAYIGMGTSHGERLSGVPRDPGQTTYWCKDSEIFMQEVRDWLTSDSDSTCDMTLSYNHTCLAVTDCVKSASFYQKVFDGRILKSIADGKAIFLRLPGSFILELFQKISQPPDFKGHLAFQVENARNAYLRMCELGIDCGEPVTRPSGNAIFLIYDPDGHKIEIIQHAEGMDPRKWDLHS